MDRQALKPNQKVNTPVTPGMTYRQTLKEKKPGAYKKLQEFLAEPDSRKTVGNIDIAYDWACNMNCCHCFTTLLQRDPKNPDRKFTPELLKFVCDQADQMGVYAINLQGGEPLFWENLDEIIEAIGPERFNLSLVTNGLLLDRDMAKSLIGWQVDRICISIDSGNAEEHDEFRRFKGSFEKAVKAIDICMENNIVCHIQTVVTHQSLHSRGFESLLEFAMQRQIGITVINAMPVGQWRGQTDLLITEEDAQYIQKLHEEVYPLLRRDITPVNDIDTGCRAITYALYITSSGEVLPCPFLHFTLGNVFDTPLKDILAKGYRVSYFREYQPKCLAGEDREFIDKYVSKTFTSCNIPVPIEEIFDFEKTSIPEEL